MKKTLIRIALFMVMFLTFSNAFAQELPPELRNFLITYGKSTSLGAYDEDLMINTVSEDVMDTFIDLFLSPEVMVYNDVYHNGSSKEYITVQQYCDLIAEYYPEGLRSFVYSPRLLKITSKNGAPVYEVVVEKYLDIDFGMDNPPHVYFDLYTKLKLSIVYTNNEYKIIMIEQPDGALLSQSWLNKAIPQNISLGGGIGSSTLAASTSANGFGDITSEHGKLQYGSIHAGWDLWGKKQFKMGIMAGLEYGSGSASLFADDYHVMVPMLDVDNYEYMRIIDIYSITQEYSFNNISIPLGVHFDYALGQQWKPFVRSAKEAKKRYPVKRSLSFQLNAGVKFNYISNAMVDANSGKYNYSGRYGFYNQIIEDTSYVVINDLPSYGFYSDTAFSIPVMESNMNQFFVSGFASLNVKYPINTWCEVFGGAMMNFSLAPVNQTGEKEYFSTQLGESANLMAFNEVSLNQIGVNAGLVFNLNPPKQQFYHYPDFGDLKSYKASSGMKYRGSKMKAEVTIASQTNFRQKLIAEMTGEWISGSETFKVPAGKMKKLKLKIPADKEMKSGGALLIHKPFGVEVTSVDCPGKNDVNSKMLEFSLNEVLNGDDCVVNHQINLKVDKLPDFNFVYVTLLGRDDSKSRKDLVDEIRKIYRKARFDNEEILVYISTEINRPVVFCNFEVPELDYIDYKVFGADDFDEFAAEIKNRYNSAIEDKDDDIHNIESVIGDNFGISQRMNASRRYVNYYFLPVDARYYRVPGYIEEADNSVIQELILAITNKYCLDVPASKDQYKVYVHLRADQYGEINVGNGTPMNECNNKIVLY